MLLFGGRDGAYSAWLFVVFMMTALCFSMKSGAKLNRSSKNSYSTGLSTDQRSISSILIQPFLP